MKVVQATGFDSPVDQAARLTGGVDVVLHATAKPGGAVFIVLTCRDVQVARAVLTSRPYQFKEAADYLGFPTLAGWFPDAKVSPGFDNVVASVTRQLEAL
jgi:hypothetical protein